VWVLPSGVNPQFTLPSSSGRGAPDKTAVTCGDRYVTEHLTVYGDKSPGTSSGYPRNDEMAVDGVVSSRLLTRETISSCDVGGVGRARNDGRTTIDGRKRWNGG